MDSEAKRWIESRLSWLSRQFGLERFTQGEVVVPTPEYFPDPFDGGQSAVRKMTDRVCRYMDVDRRLVNLQFFESRSEPWLVDEQGRYLPPGAAGLYESRRSHAVIHLEASQSLHPQELVGTIAHELAHFRLMGEERVTGNEFDNELLTDLTVVYHGLGVFLGNVPRNWDSLYDVWPGTERRRPEYMTLPMYGYALSHAAWWRGEKRPDWMRYMSSDLKACFKQGVRFLFESGDSMFAPRQEQPPSA